MSLEPVSNPSTLRPTNLAAMNRSPLPLLPILFAASVLSVGANDPSKKPENSPKPKLSQSGEVVEVQRIDGPLSFYSLTSTELSPDDTHLYTAAFNADTATVWHRDPQTGLLEWEQILSTNETNGMLALRMAPNGKYLAGASIKDVVTLYRRDSETGRLTYLSKVMGLENGAGDFDFPIEVRISPDSKFVYAACRTSLEVFKIEDDVLVGVQSKPSQGNSWSLRDVDISPDGKFLYASGRNSLLIFSRDEKHGEITLLSHLIPEEGKLASLKGLNSASCSPDNRHVYLNTGRFTDRSFVTAMKRKKDGSLTVIETWGNPATESNQDEIPKLKKLFPEQFHGGNEIEVSPDGEEVWALGTESDSIARFRRNPDTGRLTYVESIDVKGPDPKIGPSGICFSKDSRFAYIADEHEAALVVFERVEK